MGDRVRILRVQLADMTQRELATEIGLESPDTVTRLENAVSNRINLSALHGLIVLAEKKGRDANWLLVGKTAKRGPDPEWLATATKEEIVCELVRSTRDMKALETMLRYIDDPTLRRPIAEALAKGEEL